MRLTERGWVVTFLVTALLVAAFLIWSDSTWAGPVTAEREIAWLDL